jgi:transposase-like protein
MTIALDEDALAGLKSTSRERKLSTAERIAIYAFHLKGVPAKLIARTFGVRPNAIYYITNWTHTAAHDNVKSAYEQMGEDKVWAEIVTDAQTQSINEGMNKLMQGKKLDNRGYRRRLKPGGYRIEKWETFAEALPDTPPTEDSTQ